MRVSIALSAIFLGAAWPAATQQPGPLAQLESGAWQLRDPGGNAAGIVCLGDPLLLAQPQHGPQPCTREILSTDAHNVTVDYVCPGMGRGRTVLRVETPRLVQIDSQGLHNGQPFALRAQARRTGPC
ncbi:MAG: hypothetical protein QOJ53_1550 [Sphingomonadales bacterium]|jgi:hypothetical protein|nr:hypothetical protein [Sphingomonadales bacterium]MEA3044976.1 hypothetical protein [Sphingomonadales bacterium]MEA3047218.1 hypothetical protein [Sphingomonadales bacterium]